MARLFDALKWAEDRLVDCAALVRSLKKARAGALAFALGATSALAMAPTYLWPVLFVTLSASVWLLDGVSACPRPLRAAAWRGWAFGAGYFLGGLYWIAYPFLVNSEVHAWLIPFVLVIFPGGLALFFVFSFVGASLVWTNGWLRLVVLATFLSLGEWLRGNIFTGFPWNLFGYTWSYSPWMMQFASVVGIYGMSLMTLLAAMALGGVVQSNGAIERRRRWLVLFAISVPLAMVLFGLARVPSLPQPDIAGIRLRIVQPNIPQSEKWTPDLLARNWKRLVQPLTQAGAHPFTHAIWPEAAPPFLIAEQPDALRVVAEILPNGAVLLTGAQYREPGDAGTYNYFNGILAIDTDGVVVAKTAKSHLVPFGEYMPFAEILAKLGIAQLTGGPSGFTSGTHVQSITLQPQFGVWTTVGTLICYEIVFPGEVVDPKKRPDWLVNLTDDSWFGPSSGPYQHLGISRMRAVEEGLSVVRSANTGISAVIDPFGRLVAELPLNIEGTLDTGVPQKLAKTIYAAWGFVIYPLAMAGLAGLIAGARWRRYSARSRSSVQTTG